MNITTGKPIKQPETPRNKYRVYVSTMEGYADDTHYFTRDFDENEIEAAIKAIDEVNGIELDYESEEAYPEFDKYFKISNISCDQGGTLDVVDDYSVTYFDENGAELEVFKDGKNLSSCLGYNKAH
jgi:hypothetical protein